MMPYRDRKNRVCGFLNIEEGNNKQPSFIRRYFIIDNEDAKLKLFLDSPLNLSKNARMPCREINLNHISKVSDARKQKPKIAFCFVMNTAGDQCFLQADSEEDMKEWIEHLNSACKVRVPEADRTKLGQPEMNYKTVIIGEQAVKIQEPAQPAGEPSVVSDSEEEFRSGEHTIPAFQMPAVMSGSAVKQGAVRKNWKRRYFVLNNNGLAYFKSEQDKYPIKTIEIEEMEEARLVDGAHHPHRDNLFEIGTSKRVFYVQCDTPDESRRWVEAINEQVTMLKATNQPQAMGVDTEKETKSDESQALTKPGPGTTPQHGDKPQVQEEIKPSRSVWGSLTAGNQEAGDRRSKPGIRNSKKSSWLLSW